MRGKLEPEKYPMDFIFAHSKEISEGKVEEVIKEFEKVFSHLPREEIERYKGIMKLHAQGPIYE